MDAPAISFRNIGKRYPDGTRALDDVSLDVPRGQFCVLLGPSGAGKSTLLRMANRLAEPTEGRVIIEGRDLTPRTVKSIRRRIGMIHQSFNLVGRLSVASNIMTGALPALGHARVLAGLFPETLKTKACMLAASVGLDPAHMNRRADSLSGGQQQRVGIARAFMLDPAIVLADEPVASLDPRISTDILALIRDQARVRGATVLCSLHQIELARAFADRIVALRHGRLVFDGAPADLDRNAIRAIYGEAGPVPIASGGLAA